MYLRGSKWSMRQRRKPINWFLVVILSLLIVGMIYVDRVVAPTITPPFLPTPTVTRNPASYVSEAQDLFNQGKFAKSIDTYNEAIQINPSDASLYVAVAQVQIYAGKYDDALTSSENALLLNPDNSMAYAVHAWALDKKASLAANPDYTDADTSIKKALTLDANNGVAHAYYALLLGDMFQNNTGPYTDPIQNAIAESNAAISLAPDRLESHWARALILQLTGNNEEAVQEYLNAIQISPNIADLHLDLGITYRAIGDIDKALEQYQLANTLNPTDYRPSLYSSRALAAIGDYAKAIQYAQQAVTNSPTDPYLRGNLGVWLFKYFQWPDALTQLALAVNGGQSDDGQIIKPQQLTGGDPRIAQYYYTFAILLSKNDRCSEALPITQQLMKTVPNDSDAMYNAQYVIDQCQAALGTPSVVPSATPKTTPTP
jgi:tetratricopeptide (TPR) repeat protein